MYWVIENVYSNFIVFNIYTGDNGIKGDDDLLDDWLNDLNSTYPVQQVCHAFLQMLRFLVCLSVFVCMYMCIYMHMYIRNSLGYKVRLCFDNPC